MLGRSDGTLNPNGVRFGSAEIYNIVEGGRVRRRGKRAWRPKAYGGKGMLGKGAWGYRAHGGIERMGRMKLGGRRFWDSRPWVAVEGA